MTWMALRSGRSGCQEWYKGRKSQIDLAYDTYEIFFNILNQISNHMAQCFNCGKKGMFLSTLACSNCKKQMCASCTVHLPAIDSDFYNTLRNERFGVLQNKRQRDFDAWKSDPYHSGMNRPLKFCNIGCLTGFIQQQMPVHFRYVRNQMEVLISTFTLEGQRVVIIRDAIPPQLIQAYDQGMDFERNSKMAMAKNYETAGKFEECGRLYDELGLWEEAGRVRSKAKQTTNVAVDVNRLIEQMRKGGLTTTYNCPKCSAAIEISGDSSPQGLKFCNYCGTTIQVHDLADVLQKIL